MKRFIAILSLLTVVTCLSYAQKTDIRYKDVKDQYNSKAYTRQSTDPGLAGQEWRHGFCTDSF